MTIDDQQSGRCLPTSPILLISATGCILHLFFPIHPLIGAGVFLCWVTCAGLMVGKRMLEASVSSVAEHMTVGFGMVFAMLVTALSIGYLVFDLQNAVIVTVVVVMTGIVWRWGSGTVLQVAKPVLKLRDWSTGYLVLVFIGQGLLFWQFIGARTNQAVNSPWAFFDASLFIIYGLTTWLLLHVLYERSDVLATCAAWMHAFVSLSVVAIIVQLGFGFDPFIHRAAERVMAETGSIEPKRFLYTGQYVLVSTLHRITDISVARIDIWLTPVLASVSLPIIGRFGLRRGLDVSARWARVGGLAVFLVPYLSFVFTVPHNLNVVLFLWLVLLLPLFTVRPAFRYFGIMLAISMLFIHPLLGAPACALVFGSVLWGRIKSDFGKSVCLFALFAVSVGLLPTLFAVHNWMQGVDPIVWRNPITHREAFFALFRDPFKHDLFPVPAVWDWIYSYRTFIPPLLSVLGLGAILTQKRIRDRLLPYAFFVFGTMGALWLVSTLFVFPDIIPREQQEFSLRVLQVTYLSLMPVVVARVGYFWERRERSFAWLSAVFVVMAVCMTFAWYMSYPQNNPKVVQAGYSMRLADIEAVRKIDAVAGDVPYFVLSNQMTSVAALREFGFDRYLTPQNGERILWYPLPTGGELYTYYLSMLFDGADRETVRRAARFTQTELGFFIVPNYWPNVEHIRKSAAQHADASIDVAGGQIVIYKYHFDF